jgi:hypothetical protein
MAAAYSIETTPCDPFSSAWQQAETMETYLRSDVALRASHAELEASIEQDGREWMRRMMQAHLKLRAAAERPVQVKGADGIERRQKRRDTTRPLGMLFGSVEVIRLAYQRPGVEGLHPMDAALQLPSELYSYGVGRLIAERAALGSYEDVVRLMAARTGAAVGKRQVEELAIRAAADFEAFYAKRTVHAEETSDLLVLSFDGAGIIMRPDDLRPSTKKAAAKKTRKLGTRLAKGEKRNRKRMAEVAAIYTVAPLPRTVMDVVHDLHPVQDVEKKRPKPQNKQVSASVELDTEQVIAQTFQEALRRDPKRKRRWVVLVDGNKDQLAAIRKAAKDVGVQVTVILDLMHVLEYLWKAAHCFHADGTKQAEAWVEQRLIGLLQGQTAGYLAKGMRRNAKARRLSVKARKPVDECARYLVNKSKLLHYDRALRDGLPIATGVIEGACRYLVRDRMDRTGARWSLIGAEAVLRLRALVTNGDFDDYWTFHLAREYERNHTACYAGGFVPCPLPSAQRKLRRVK